MNATDAPAVRPPQDRKRTRRLKDWKPSAEPVDVFRGRAGTTDLKVLQSLRAISKSCDWVRPMITSGPMPPPVFHASVRLLAMMTGLSKDAVWRALFRLGPRRRNFVRRVEHAQGTDAAAYAFTPECLAWLRQERLRLEARARNKDTLVSLRYRSVLVTRGLRVSGRPSDCWARLGVPKSMVYDLLDDQPQTVAELTHLYRKSGSTLRKHLAGLRTHGLAEREGGGWVRGQASPDDVAAALGSSGAGEHKAKRYQEERERWKEWTRRERTQRPEVVDAFQRKMLAASDTTSVEVTA